MTVVEVERGAENPARPTRTASVSTAPVGTASAALFGGDRLLSTRSVLDWSACRLHFVRTHMRKESV